MRICISKALYNKVINNNHMQKIIRFMQSFAFLGRSCC